MRRLLPILLALALTGCGSEQQPRLSAAEFVRRADAVCSTLAVPAYGTVPIERLLVRVAAAGETRYERLRAFRPPEAQAPMAARWLGAQRDLVAAAESYLAALKGDRSEDLQRLSTAFAVAEAKAAGYARRLGVHACDPEAQGTLSP